MGEKLKQEGKMGPGIPVMRYDKYNLQLIVQGKRGDTWMCILVCKDINESIMSFSVSVNRIK